MRGPGSEERYAAREKEIRGEGTNDRGEAGYAVGTASLSPSDQAW